MRSKTKYLWAMGLAALSVAQGLPRAGDQPPAPLTLDRVPSLPPFSVAVTQTTRNEFVPPLVSLPRLPSSVSPSILGIANERLTADGFQIAGVLSHQAPSLIPTFPAPAQTGQQLAARGLNWDDGMPLPGAFNPSWSLPKTDFNPAFTTPYFSAEGVLNAASPEAPWNFSAQGGL